MTPNQSALMIMANALRFKWSDLELETNLRTIDLHLPYKLHKSKYRFLKTVPEPNVEKCYYAPVCFCPLTFEPQSNDTVCGCDRQAKHSRKELDKAGSYFYYLPLTPQLQKIVESGVYQNFRHEDTSESDVINGDLYTNLLRRNIINSNTITLQINTDGVSLFNWSKSSLWPIQVLINELPYAIRKNNTILCGLWFGPDKPPMSLYLAPLIRELKVLSEVGFTTVTPTSPVPILMKVHALLVSVDSIARPMVQNIKQFNGSFGCSFCLNAGRKLGSKGNVHVYCGTKIPMRTMDMYSRWLKSAERNNHAVKGIKGRSELSKLENFDIFQDCPADYLHAVLEGVMKHLLTTWFKSKFHKREWYLGKFKNQINEIIKTISCPVEIKRILRPIQQIKYWTAAEFKYFLLYYSVPCLINFLPKKYFKHFFLFLWSINMLSQKHISDSDLDKVEKTLIKFVQGVETLYGQKFMVYNIHLLLHLVQNVKRFGALWAWSNFPFETYNGLLKTLYNGTQCIPEQIVKVYNRLTFIKQNKNEFSKGHCNEDAKNQFTKLLKQLHVTLDFVYDSDLKIFGKPQKQHLSSIEKILFENFYAVEFVDQQVTTFLRFAYKNIVYHSLSYKRMSKRINSVIETVEGKFMKIIKLMYLSVPNECYLIFGNELQIVDRDVCKYQGLTSREICRLVKETQNVICCSLENIKMKCVLIPFYKRSVKVAGKYYVFPLVNQIERD